MACTLERLALAGAFGNLILSTAAIPSGALAPPAEPLLVARWYVSYFLCIVAIEKTAQCLEAEGRGEDAATLRREIDELKADRERVKERMGQ